MVVVVVVAVGFGGGVGVGGWCSLPLLVVVVALKNEELLCEHRIVSSQRPGYLTLPYLKHCCAVTAFSSCVNKKVFCTFVTAFE